jgi:hypothetical protein
MSLPPVFADMDRFGFVHHRALNSPEAFRTAVRLAESRDDVCHVLEGDLCWDVSNGRRSYYFRHPKWLLDTLPPAEQDRARAEGRLVTLEDVLAERTPTLRYIIELKVGVGDTDAVLRDVTGLLQEAHPGRHWFDGFSLRLLAAVKRANPAAATSLHTKLVWGGWVMRSAPELFPLSLHRLKGLDYVDAVALTWKTSPARLLGAGIDAACRGVTGAGKALILGGLTSVKAFEQARASAARAGYAKFPLDELPVARAR